MSKFPTFIRAFLLLVCLPVSLLSHAQDNDGFIVTDIRIEGLQRISSGTVFNALPLNIGDRVNGTDVANAIRAVFATENFENVAIGRDGDILVVQVEERPSISEINFEGNKAIKTEQLLEGLKGAGLAEGQVLRRATLEGMRKELLRQYVGQGRYDASIDAEVVAQPRNRVAVEVTVDEGTTSRIKSINFVGNELFEDSDLRQIMELRDRGFWLFFNGKNKYAKEKFESDIENIETFYFDQGYAKFRITDAQVTISSDKKHVFLTLVMEEGEKYTFGDVEFSGDLVIDERVLETYAKAMEDQGYSQTTITSYEEFFTNMAGNIGYSFAEVTAQTEANDDDKTVDVKFFINPGKRTYVNRIDFDGNQSTKDEVLRREMRQMEMAPASNSKIEQGKLRLNRLGFFEDVQVETLPTPGTDDKVDVTYTVKEQPSGSLGASLGYAELSGLILGLNVQQNNFLGSGSSIGVGLNRSRFQTSVNFSYTNPYYTEDGVSRGFNVFYRKTNADAVGLARFRTDAYGASMNFGYPLSEIERLNFSLGFTDTTISTGLTTVQEIRTTPTLDTRVASNELGEIIFDRNEDGSPSVRTFSGFNVISGNSLTPFNDFGDVVDGFERDGFLDRNGSDFLNFNLSGSYLRSTLNRGTFATRGSQQVVSLELAVPGSELEFYKINYTGQKYFPINQDWIVRLSTRLGYGDGYGDTDALPFYEHYYFGGFGTIRGYRQNSLGPQSFPARGISFGVVDSDGDGIITNGDDGVSAIVLDENGTSQFRDNVDDILETDEFVGYTVRDQGEALAYYRDLSGNLPLSILGGRDSFGGNVMIQGSAELIFPMPFLKGSRTIRSAVFVDAGNVFSTDCRDTQIGCFSPGLEGMKYSAGIGINWLSGFGPFNFSIAKTFNHTEIDDREFFQFSLGQQF